MTANIFFEIGTFITGPDLGLAGYTAYRKYTVDADFDSNVRDFNGAKGPLDAKDRPTRLCKPGGHFDAALSVVAEPGKCRYAFMLDESGRSKFVAGRPIVEIPILWEGKEWFFLNGVELRTVDGQEFAVFNFDREDIPKSLSKAIANSGHASALKIPFYFNIVDSEMGFQPWLIDDHRYELSVGARHFRNDRHEHEHDHDHDDDHEHKHSVWHKMLNHGGIHPPGNNLAYLGNRTHGGIHPPGVASFLIVELH